LLRGPKASDKIKEVDGKINSREERGIVEDDTHHGAA
jgi:hypothetical protein